MKAKDVERLTEIRAQNYVAEFNKNAGARGESRETFLLRLLDEERARSAKLLNALRDIYQYSDEDGVIVTPEADLAREAIAAYEADGGAEGEK